MKTLRTIPAYLWAVICVLLIPAAFIGNNSFAKQLAKLPFMKINPIYSGGEIARVTGDSALKITIYKPVFEALIGESSEGFVQVKFEGDSLLPEFIQKELDFDNDGVQDFKLAINTKTNNTQFDAFNKDLIDLGISTKVKDYWIVRVEVKNPGK
jgi:hypothetical protein